jgi:hypothetical protein
MSEAIRKGKKKYFLRQRREYVDAMHFAEELTWAGFVQERKLFASLSHFRSCTFSLVLPMIMDMKMFLPDLSKPLETKEIFYWPSAPAVIHQTF